MLRPHRIVIDPGHGHSGQGFDPGITIPNQFETDLIDRFVTGFVEELETMSHPYLVLPTRKGPGLTLDQRMDAVETNSLCISIHSGHAGGKAWQGSSISTFEHAHSEYVHALLPICQTWGERTSTAYKKARYVPAAFPLLQREDAACLHFEPYCLDGVDSVKFFLRLETLAKACAQALVDVLRQQGQMRKAQEQLAQRR